jgi:trans-aconitate 2-methyltransferase
MTGDGWDPGQYDRFRTERQQPFFDLLSLLQPAPGGRAIDLGCGTGELTVTLHRRLGLSETTGIDSSPAMLAASRARAGRGVAFVLRDVADFPEASGGDGQYDVIAANASLQWVPDHVRVLRAASASLRPGGQLAFQVPANADHPSHTVAAQVAAEPQFAPLLAAGPVRQLLPVLAPEQYADLLHRQGFTEQVVRLQVYGHVLESTEAVVEWIKGSLLTPYREVLDRATYEVFVERYRARLVEELGDQRPYFYPFKRILCWARRP